MTMFSDSLRAFLRPVAEFLDDPTVTEIMINGPEDVWIERKGRLTQTAARFSEDGLLAAARNMAQYVGRPLTEETPRLDARLPDGSRIHVLLPPMARCGTVIAIRKFHPGGLTIDDLIQYGSITAEAARFLEVAVQTKKNIIVAGGTGSGKTTLLNVLSDFIPDDERILTIEDSAELQLRQQHLVPLESRAADRHGKNAVDMRDLLHSALRLRPDRIIVGEVRGGECFDLLQAMNTGHGGTLSTVHANSSRETLSRIESLALLADVGLPLRAVRAQVAAAIDLVVCANRLRDGTRRITAVSEALPLDEKGDYRVQDIFVFSQTRTRRDGKVEGYLAPTAVLPTFHERLVAEGFEDMSLPFFLPQSYGYDPPKHFVGTPVEVSAVNVKAATPKVPVKAPTSKRSSSSARHRDAATNHGAVQETATEQHQSDQLQRYDDAAYAQPQQAQQYYDDAAYQQQHAQQQQYYDDPRYQQYYDEQQQQQAHQQYYDDYDRQPQQQRQQQPPSRGGGGEIHDARRSGRGSGSGRGGSGRR
ncbi:MAG: CpaF family protein [Myxococcales bacterium]|nr:CpaF family protein [Myxococcales bacterium]